jgi:hypothetical protein
MCQRVRTLQSNVIRGPADQNREITRLRGPVFFVDVVVGECPAIGRQRHALRLAGLEIYFCEVFQLFHAGAEPKRESCRRRVLRLPLDVVAFCFNL